MKAEITLFRLLHAYWRQEKISRVMKIFRRVREYAADSRRLPTLTCPP
jgi:hypothetical protein